MNIEKQVERFFELRFPNKDIEFEKKCGYFYEWVKRFETGNPETYMDNKSLEAYKQLLKEKIEKHRLCEKKIKCKDCRYFFDGRGVYGEHSQCGASYHNFRNKWRGERA